MSRPFFYVVVRAELLEAWLALTGVKYHDNLFILRLLNQWLALTMLRTTGPRTGVQPVVNKFLRYILVVRWPTVISNEELLRRINTESIVTSDKRRKWRRIGHTLRRESNNGARQALHHHPRGKRKVGRSRINPLSPDIKLQILLLCFHTFLTELVGRRC